MTTLTTTNLSITAADGWTLVGTNPVYLYIQPHSPTPWFLAAGATAPVTISAQATGTLTFTGLPTAAETFVVGATTYTFRAAVGTTANEIKIGADATATAANVAAAINAGTGSGTVYGSDTVRNATVYASSNAGVVTLTARTAGTAGNSIVLTEALTNATVSGSGTLASGSDATIGASISPAKNSHFEKTGATTGNFYIRTSSPTSENFCIIKEQ